MHGKEDGLRLLRRWRAGGGAGRDGGGGRRPGVGETRCVGGEAACDEASQARIRASILNNAQIKYRDALNALEESICEELVLHLWREHCLSHVYRALGALCDFAQDE